LTSKYAAFSNLKLLAMMLLGIDSTRVL